MYPGFGLYSSGGAYVPYYGCDCCEGGGYDNPSVAESLDPADGGGGSLDPDSGSIDAGGGSFGDGQGGLGGLGGGAGGGGTWNPQSGKPPFVISPPNQVGPNDCLTGRPILPQPPKPNPLLSWINTPPPPSPPPSPADKAAAELTQLYNAAVTWRKSSPGFFHYESDDYGLPYPTIFKPDGTLNDCGGQADSMLRYLITLPHSTWYLKPIYAREIQTTIVKAPKRMPLSCGRLRGIPCRQWFSMRW